MRYVPALLASLTLLPVCAQEQPAAAGQIPLCMVGDSVTWAGHGDWWRRYLLEHIPTLAFVGTHSATLGYSHAGEGGNRTQQILARMDDIPDCSYYHLLVGINDSAAAKEEAQVDEVAAGAAERIAEIVNGLLQKPSAQRVFLGSILPSKVDEYRDLAGSRTNTILREQFDELFPDGRVVWVEYERALRPMDDWISTMMSGAHPTQAGYEVIAKLTADAIRDELELPDEIEAPDFPDGCGVRIVNLWEGGVDGQTSIKLIAGWYTLSVKVDGVDAAGGTLSLRSQDRELKLQLDLSFAIPADAEIGERLTLQLFTGYEGYTYNRSVLVAEADGCAVSDILLEKLRPHSRASVYGTGSYLDTQTTPAPGELIECP